MKIVFTSCMDAERVPKQPVWDQIIANGLPDVLMLIGDQIYMDWGDPGKSNWKKAIEQGGTKANKALKEFADDMHARYQRQWQVESFRKLICDFIQAKGAKNLLLCWDDHDFAWNNAVGAVGSPATADEHQVPARVKAISMALFKQFRDVLRAGVNSSAYPSPLEKMPSPDTSENGLDEFGSFAKGQVLPFALLDTRWNRTERVDKKLLSNATLIELKRQVGKTGEGLMLVIGGSPLAYKYSFSEQGWLSKNPQDLKDPAYKEYDEFLNAAKRPVLYLGGDVHLNEWSGQLSDTSGTPSRVLQVLSSGAAIAAIGPKKFSPSFASIDVAWNSATQGEANIRLVTLNNTGTPDTSTSIKLNFNGNDWIGETQGPATLLIEASADKEPLAAISFYERSTTFNDKNPTTVKSLGELNAVFKQKSPEQGVAPQCWEIQAPKVPDEINIRLIGTETPGFGGLVFESTGDDLETLITNAFERANGSKKSVMLFIHGIGHPFGSALTQAYRIRDTYPDCEPIVFTWPSGEGGSLLNALFSVPNALRNADNCAIALKKVLIAFNGVAANPKYTQLTKVVVCRSAGSLVLQHTLALLGSSAKNTFVYIHRVILSSPLMKTKDFLRPAHNASFSLLTTDKVVLMNTKDKTLKRADWQDGTGEMLGSDAAPVGTDKSNLFLNFAQSAGVESLHDYFTIEVNKPQHNVIKALLCDKVFYPAQHTDKLKADSEGVYLVL
jgi:Alpha/beta hydrolase of unknown function (DUF900)